MPIVRVWIPESLILAVATIITGALMTACQDTCAGKMGAELGDCEKEMDRKEAEKAEPECPGSVDPVPDPGSNGKNAHDLGVLSTAALCNAVGKDDVDTYSFSLEENAEFSVTPTDLTRKTNLILTLGFDENENGILEPSEQTEKEQHGEGGTMAWHLPKSQKFLLQATVGSGELVSYVLNFAATPFVDASGDEDPGSKPATALPINGLATGYVGRFDTEDFWSFAVAMKSTVALTVTDAIGSDCGFYVLADANGNGIYDSGENNIAPSLWGGLRPAMTSQVLERGDYYVRVSGATVDSRKGCLYSMQIGQSPAK